MQYVEWLNNLQFPPLSSPADFLCLDMSLEWMSWLTPIGFGLRHRQITRQDPQGGHAPPGFEMFATTCPHLARGCQKPGTQLRTDLSGGCWRGIALRTYSGARWYCIIDTHAHRERRCDKTVESCRVGESCKLSRRQSSFCFDVQTVQDSCRLSTIQSTRPDATNVNSFVA